MQTVKTLLTYLFLGAAVCLAALLVFSLTGPDSAAPVVTGTVNP